MRHSVARPVQGRVAALLVLVVLACAVAGCIKPFRVHVDPGLVDRNRWQVDEKPIEGGLLAGRKITETFYRFDHGTSNPPFPGTLQVFSLREVKRSSSADLLDLARTAVEKGAREQGIRLEATEQDGARALRNGAESTFFARAGTVVSGNLFSQDSKVRILGETFHDGVSRTSVVLVAIAQVQKNGPLPLQVTTDQATWVQVVGDPRGSVQGATSDRGFIYNLVSH